MNHKKLLLIACLSFFGLPLFAQVNTTVDVNLVKEIPVKKFVNKAFKASVDIKNQPSDVTGQASFFMLQVGKSDYDFINHTGKGSLPAKNDTTWHHYELQGTIDPNAQKMWLYINTKGNGNFYYDNFGLEIETAPGVWTKIEVPNGDFEQATNPLKDYKGTESLKTKTGLSISLEKTQDPRYLSYIHIAATGGKIIERYGQNSSRGQYVNSQGCKIYYEIYGQGEPLLLLHGNGGSIASFKAQIPELAKHYQVIAVDTRGQGKSTDTQSSSFSYNQFADDMKTLLDTLKLKQVNVVGWSDGGNTGLILAMKHPNYVKKLVALGANLNPSEEAVSTKILNQAKKDLAKLQAKNEPQDQVTIRLLQMILTEPQIDPASLKTISAKTLILAGEKDLILEPHTQLIGRSIPNAQVLILKGQTHFVPEENPALFTQTVLDFLAKP
ncbi:alpha/beta hydrolase [Pedobacter sp. KR3-3]|uniref:Alpha/beta hydrolase n=1 Tax=Pedobacter albus TaxID=3113905 RepID=A0ABU7I3C4_9SPHI|nr:alpha/beta hydrolase [Pedobacter sp. KR3-3]MEE1943960.1 alpha/beta hydrolase [Pedobacter sp. KR3-3]